MQPSTVWLVAVGSILHTYELALVLFWVLRATKHDADTIMKVATWILFITSSLLWIVPRYKDQHKQEIFPL